MEKESQAERQYEELISGNCTVYMHRNHPNDYGVSTARLIAEDILRLFSQDVNDFRARDNLIMLISKKLDIEVKARNNALKDALAEIQRLKIQVIRMGG